MPTTSGTHLAAVRTAAEPAHTICARGPAARQRCGQGSCKAGNGGKPSIRAVHLARVATRTYGRHMMGFLVERYWPGVTAADVDAVDRRLRRLGGTDATFIASTLIPAD